MSNAKHDGNFKPTWLALDSSNGTGKVPLKANPANNGLKIINAATGTDYGNDFNTDDNHVPSIFALSNADGITLVSVYADATTGSLLIDNT